MKLPWSGQRSTCNEAQGIFLTLVIVSVLGLCDVMPQMVSSHLNCSSKNSVLPILHGALMYQTHAQYRNGKIDKGEVNTCICVLCVKWLQKCRFIYIYHWQKCLGIISYRYVKIIFQFWCRPNNCVYNQIEMEMSFYEWFVAGCSQSCQHDNCWSNQWLKFCQNDRIFRCSIGDTQILFDYSRHMLNCFCC